MTKRVSREWGEWGWVVSQLRAWYQNSLRLTLRSHLVFHETRWYEVPILKCMETLGNTLMLILLEFNFHDVLILFAQTASPAFTLYIRREETILSPLLPSAVPTTPPPPFPFTNSTGGPSSSCEIIILRNKSLGEIIRLCMGIFTTALRKKKFSPYFHRASLVIWPLTMLKRTILASYPFLGLLRKRSPMLHTPFPNARSEKREIQAQNDRAATNPTHNPSIYTVV